MARAVCVCPSSVGDRHGERVDGLRRRRREALQQLVRAVVVHEEADRAAVHAVDGLARVHRVAQRLQHQPVAAERHDDVRLAERRVAVAGAQQRRRFEGLGRVAGENGDPGHGRTGWEFGRAGTSMRKAGRERQEGAEHE